MYAAIVDFEWSSGRIPGCICCNVSIIHDLTNQCHIQLYTRINMKNKRHNVNHVN